MSLVLVGVGRNTSDAVGGERLMSDISAEMQLRRRKEMA